MLSAFNAVPARVILGVMMFFACWVNYMMRVNMSVNLIAMVYQNSSSNSSKGVGDGRRWNFETNNLVLRISNAGVTNLEQENCPVEVGYICHGLQRSFNIRVKGECAALDIENKSRSLFDESEFFVSREWRPRQETYSFYWTAQQEATVLSSYVYGYAIASFFSGKVVEIVGPRRLVFSTTLISAVLNILSPSAAYVHYMMLVAARFVIGLCGGFLLPTLHDLVSRWAPPHEKGRFVSCLLGGAIGTVFTWSLSGPLLERYDWEYAFYIPSALIIAWSFLWWFLVYDSPVEHPRISESEKEYILKAIGDRVKQSTKDRLTPPWKTIFTSSPFLAMVVLNFGNSWGMYFIMLAIPKYISSAMGFKLSSTGFLASLPYLARMLFSIVFGAIGDRIFKLNVISLTTMRKIFCIFSHIIPGILLCSIGYTGCSPILSIALITFSLGFNGAAALTNLVNHQDLAPNFASALFGVANGIGNTAGIITPYVTAHFTKNGNGFAEWRPVFIAGATVYIGAAIYFIIFGTGVMQSWNYVTPLEDKETKSKKPTAEV